MPVLQPIAADFDELRGALEAADLPTEDIGDAGRHFFRLDVDGAAVAFGGYELCGEHALLRSVVVASDRRGEGFGKVVTELVLAQAGEAGARYAYLLTTRAQDYFEHAGFTPIDRGKAPQQILATRQAASFCTTATLLTRRIDG